MGVKPGSAKPALVCSRGLTSKVKSSYCMVEIILVQRQEKNKRKLMALDSEICGILQLLTLTRFEDNLKRAEDLFQKTRFHCKGFSYITEVIRVSNSKN